MEENENVDMLSGYDNTNEEMNAEESYGNDNDFNASDDDENTNYNQPTR